MSILINGMEMPTDGCHHMICIYADGTVSTGGRVYMAVPVPPHGRLIDLDETVLAQYYDEEHEEWSMETATVEDILYGICENMPPIVIPADKDGESR